MKRVFLVLIFGFFLTAVYAGSGWSGGPLIDIEKLVSVDGGSTWHDADTVGGGPTTPVGQGALYRLVVSNPGSRALSDVEINDPDLGITAYMVGALGVGEAVVLDEGDIPELSQPNRCATEGEFENIASVSGQFESTTVTDSDPAWVKCLSPLIPCIDIEKLVSVDGGTTWADADTVGEAQTVPIGGGVLYRLVVSNCGDTALTDVEINDPDLGITGYMVGALAVGQTVILDESDIPELSQPNRCTTEEEFENIASVSGQFESTTVTDSDPAWVICPPRGDQGCTPGYWKQSHHFDSWVGYQPTDTFEEVFARMITIRWKAPAERPHPVEDPTLLEALEARGGGINALARHTVAALLNAANPDVNSMYTVGEVIGMFQAAFDSGDFETTKNMLMEANEFGCPLN